MLFTALALSGLYLVEPERVEDERGFFARTWCAAEARARGLVTPRAQAGVSFSKRRGTLRGLHYQEAPHAEVRLVRCTRGAIYDVVVDLRPDSPTYLRHVVTILSADSRATLYVPEGCAHGFQTLEDATEVAYQMSRSYAPQAVRGVRWDDPRLAIAWPPAERVIAERDRSWPDVVPARAAP